jgi:hypothetical protein
MTAQEWVQMWEGEALVCSYRTLQRQRRFSRYLNAIWDHGWHIVIMAVQALVFGIHNWSVLWVFLSISLAIETLMISIVLLPKFRRWVDQQELQELRLRVEESEKVRIAMLEEGNVQDVLDGEEWENRMKRMQFREEVHTEWMKKMSVGGSSKR